MRVYKMQQWKIKDILITALGAISGFISYVKSMPMLSIGSELLGILKGCASALVIAMAAAAGKKLGEHLWEKAKQHIQKTKSGKNV